MNYRLRSNALLIKFLFSFLKIFELEASTNKLSLDLHCCRRA
nr:MAG TPA: hypothetical protein [Caudoviricetes sp.]